MRRRTHRAVVDRTRTMLYNIRTDDAWCGRARDRVGRAYTRYAFSYSLMYAGLPSESVAGSAAAVSMPRARVRRVWNIAGGPRDIIVRDDTIIVCDVRIQRGFFHERFITDRITYVFFRSEIILPFFTQVRDFYFNRVLRFYRVPIIIFAFYCISRKRMIFSTGEFHYLFCF